VRTGVYASLPGYVGLPTTWYMYHPPTTQGTPNHPKDHGRRLRTHAESPITALAQRVVKLTISDESLTVTARELSTLSVTVRELSTLSVTAGRCTTRLCWSVYYPSMLVGVYRSSMLVGVYRSSMLVGVTPVYAGRCNTRLCWSVCLTLAGRCASLLLVGVSLSARLCVTFCSFLNHFLTVLDLFCLYERF